MEICIIGNSTPLTLLIKEAKMKYYMYANPYNEYTCISNMPMEFDRFVEVYDLSECFGDDEGFYFESTNDQNGPWVHIDVERRPFYQIQPYAKGSK
jgi:hypothetical protein